MWRWYNKLTYPYIFLWLFDFLIFFFLIYNLHMIIQVVCLHYFQNNHNQKKKKRPTYNIHLFSLDSWLSVQWFEWRDKVLKKILVEKKVTCFLLDHMQFPQVSEEEKKKPGVFLRISKSSLSSSCHSNCDHWPVASVTQKLVLSVGSHETYWFQIGTLKYP